jgi:hypothetical protein
MVEKRIESTLKWSPPLQRLASHFCRFAYPPHMFLSGSMAQRIQVISRHLQQKKAFEEKNGATRRLASFEAGPHIVSTVIFGEKKSRIQDQA